MTSSTLAFSEIEPFNNKKNKTRRTREPLQNRKKVEAMINKIHKIEPLQSIYEDNQNDDDDENDGLADFNPPPMAESAGVTRMRERREKNDTQNEERINYTAYSDIPKQFSIPTPYVEEKQPQKRQSKEDVIDVKLLMEKLNYVISMLEEQQDEKINNITEEVVLYCFLGIFIIYVIDSFAKVGKYVR